MPEKRFERFVVDGNNVGELAKYVGPFTDMEGIITQPVLRLVAELQTEARVRAVIFSTLTGSPRHLRTRVLAKYVPGDLDAEALLDHVEPSYIRMDGDLRRAGFQNQGYLDYEPWSKGVEQRVLTEMKRQERIVGHFVFSGRGREFIV